MPIRKFIPHDVAFDPLVIQAMDEAFDSAWRIIEHARLLASQEAVAEKIIAAAAAGVRDAELLRDTALRAVGLHR